MTPYHQVKIYSMYCNYTKSMMTQEWTYCLNNTGWLAKDKRCVYDYEFLVSIQYDELLKS